MAKRVLYIVLFKIVFLTVGFNKAYSQEFPYSLQYITNMNTINPSYVGIWDQGGLYFSTRANWITITGAPLIYNFSYYTPSRELNSGFGFNIQRNSEGREKRLFLTGDYAYQIRLGFRTFMRFGLRGGIVNYDNALSDYQLYPDRIPDPEFTSDLRLYYMTVFGFGTMVYSDQFYLGLSMPQLINNTFSVNRDYFSSSQKFTTVYLTGGYVFKLSNTVRVRPNLLVVGTFGKSVYFDVASVFYLQNELQFGLNLRSNGTITFSGQYTFNNNLRIGYAADYALVHDINKYQLGSYEFVIGYIINKGRRTVFRPAYF